MTNNQNFFSSFIEKVQNAGNKKFVFLLMGRTGVGKSSTINSLMGKSIAQVGDYEPTTMKIEFYESEINGINFTVIDTPGLCDDIEEEGNDERYLKSICSKIKQIDSMWFVSRLDETRVTSDEKRGIKLLSKTFGKKAWECSVIVFTFANSVSASEYQETVDKRTELIRREIAKYAGGDIANQIPSIAVDNYSETTPDGKQWLGEFFTRVFVRASESGSLPFAAAMKESLFSSSGEPRIKLDQQQKAEVKNKINKGLIGGLASGGAVAGLFLGPGGTIVGGLLGTVVGLWLELERKHA